MFVFCRAVACSRIKNKQRTIQIWVISLCGWEWNKCRRKFHAISHDVMCIWHVDRYENNLRSEKNSVDNSVLFALFSQGRQTLNLWAICIHKTAMKMNQRLPLLCNTIDHSIADVWYVKQWSLTNYGNFVIEFKKIDAYRYRCTQTQCNKLQNLCTFHIYNNNRFLLFEKWLDNKGEILLDMFIYWLQSTQIFALTLFDIVFFLYGVCIIYHW